MKISERHIVACVFAGWFASCVLLSAHEAPGRAGHKEGEQAHAMETDIFVGPDGYLHGGLGILQPLGEDHKAGLTFHIVREETGGNWFPSLGAEVGRHFENGTEVELYSFGYFPVENQHCWAVGARLLKAFGPADDWTLTPFVGPTFARVRALDETTEEPLDVNHTMLLGGLLLARDPLEIGVFGSHSWFSRNTRELETHVDLEEMTHLAAYENNDGFARDSVGAEVTWEVVARLRLAARYAAIFFPEESTRHSVTLLPSVELVKGVQLSAGAQWLRGAGFDRALFAGGFALEF